MAKIAPKGNKVTGTKKKDKITWVNSKAWKKALTVNALAGNDVINFKKSKYKNKLYGQEGNDIIYGGTKNDLIDGGVGKDKLYGYNGNDTLKGGKGNDYIDGGNGNDKIYGNYNTNTLKGGAGNDSIYGGTGTDKIYAGKGNDFINAGKGTNYIYLNKNEDTNTIANGKGKDTVIFSQEKNFDNFTFADSGSDLKVSAGGTTAVLKGFVAGKSSVINIKAGNLSFSKLHRYVDGYEQVINGISGNDLLFSNGSWYNDYHMGNGNDILYLDGEYEGDIYLDGGNDYLKSSDGEYNEIYAGAGNDTLILSEESCSDVYGGDGNDYIEMTNGEYSYIIAGAGNDKIVVTNSEEMGIYASEGNNNINIKSSEADIYLGGMNGNDTIVNDWDSDITLNFKYGDEYSSTQNEMIRTLQLAEGDGTFNYVLGQKSGNNLVLTTINGKTVTISDFYVGYNEHWDEDFYIHDYDGTSIDIYRALNYQILSGNPAYNKLTGNSTQDNLTGTTGHYIYGKNDTAYDVIMNNTSYNNVIISGTGAKTINVQNFNLNYMEVYGGNQTVNLDNVQNNYIDIYGQNGGSNTQTITIQNAQNNHIETGGGQMTLTFSGSNNYVYSGGATAGSVFNLTGNNIDFETYKLSSSTINLNGNGNYAFIKANNGHTVTINTQGQNKVVIVPQEYYDAPTFNVNSTGNDYFKTTDVTNTVTKYINFDFTGSEGKNKEIETGLSNDINITGINEIGELKLSMHYPKHLIMHANGEDSFTISDFNPDTMSRYSSGSGSNKASIVIIKGEEGQGAADLNTTEIANKIKLQTSEYNGEYKTLDNFAQYFAIGDSFTFGAETNGYMDNLTKDYLVYSSSGESDTTYSDYQFSTGRHTIKDNGGDADVLTINEDINNIRMYFNISNTGSILDSDLYFVKTSEFQNFMKGTEVSGYVNIQKGIGAGQVEDVEITTEADVYVLNYSNLTNNLNSLIADVTSWMTGKEYANTDAVISTGTDADKTALFNIYNSHTDFANNTQNAYWDIPM